MRGTVKTWSTKKQAIVSFKRTYYGAAGGGYEIGNPDSRVIALVEAPLDAISLYQLNPNLRIIPGGDDACGLQHLNINFSDPNLTVLSGFDNDKAGEHCHSNLLNVFPAAERLLPGDGIEGVKDWNQLLQHRAHSI